MSPENVKKRLLEKYKNASIDVVDTTGEESHFHIEIISKDFQGLSRVQSHQSVMSLFDIELKSGEIHAMSIKTQTPEQGDENV